MHASCRQGRPAQERGSQLQENEEEELMRKRRKQKLSLEGGGMGGENWISKGGGVQGACWS